MEFLFVLIVALLCATSFLDLLPPKKTAQETHYLRGR